MILTSQSGAHEKQKNIQNFDIGSRTSLHLCQNLTYRMSKFEILVTVCQNLTYCMSKKKHWLSTPTLRVLYLVVAKKMFLAITEFPFSIIFEQIQSCFSTRAGRGRSRGYYTDTNVMIVCWESGSDVPFGAGWGLQCRIAIKVELKTPGQCTGNSSPETFLCVLLSEPSA